MEPFARLLNIVTVMSRCAQSVHHLVTRQTRVLQIVSRVYLRVFTFITPKKAALERQKLDVKSSVHCNIIYCYIAADM
jgi:hypothetical protein